VKCVGLRVVLPAANSSRDETAYIMHANSECVDEYALETCEKLAKLCPETVELIKENIKTHLRNQLQFDNDAVMLYWLLDDDIDGYDCEIYDLVNGEPHFRENVFIPADETDFYADIDLKKFENFKKSYAKIALQSLKYELDKRIRAGILHEQLVFARSISEKLLDYAQKLKQTVESVKEQVKSEELQFLKSAKEITQNAQTADIKAHEFLNLLLTFNERVLEQMKKELEKRQQRINELEQRVKELEQEKERLRQHLKETNERARFAGFLKRKARQLYEKVASKISVLKQLFRRKRNKNRDRGPEL
jgi:hypothetical protein